MDTMLSSSQTGVRVEAAALSAVNFALQQNRAHQVRSRRRLRDPPSKMTAITETLN